MRAGEHEEPDVVAALAAIDATLDGDSVGPEHAELAELALILREQRPLPSADVARELDARVLTPPAARAATRQRRSIPWGRLIAGPVAVAAAIVLVIVLVNRGGGGSPSMMNGAVGAASSSVAGGSTSAGSSAAGGVKRSGPSRSAPAPAATGAQHRQVVQSSRLTLSTAPAKIEDVAQQVFDVVSSEHGYVDSSHVTATGGPDGLARFQLTVPQSELQSTVDDLSRLHGAHVLSRTDDTSDITGQVGGAGRRLAQERALRRSLLRRLAAATTSSEVSSLQGELRKVNAQIDHNESALSGLHRHVQYSNVSVTIEAVQPPTRHRSSGGGFGLHRALHDAGRVLVIVAGGALIALAVLVPLGLLVAIVAWAVVRVRRHRREAVLDLF